MQDYFIWNGTDCRQYGIHVTEQPPITIPAERSTQTNVPGRPGSLTQLEGEDVYDDLLLTATCFISDPAQIPSIAAWLKGSGTVTFANRPGGYYKARIVNQISFEKILRGQSAPQLCREFPVLSVFLRRCHRGHYRHRVRGDYHESRKRLFRADPDGVRVRGHHAHGGNDCRGAGGHLRQHRAGLRAEGSLQRQYPDERPHERGVPCVKARGECRQLDGRGDESVR